MVDILGMFRRRPAKRSGFARARDDITALGDSFGDMLSNPVRDAPPIAREAPAPRIDPPAPSQQRAPVQPQQPRVEQQHQPHAEPRQPRPSRKATGPAQSRQKRRQRAADGDQGGLSGCA